MCLFQRATIDGRCGLRGAVSFLSSSSVFPSAPHEISPFSKSSFLMARALSLFFPAGGGLSMNGSVLPTFPSKWVTSFLTPAV